VLILHRATGPDDATDTAIEAPLPHATEQLPPAPPRARRRQRRAMIGLAAFALATSAVIAFVAVRGDRAGTPDHIAAVHAADTQALAGAESRRGDGEGDEGRAVEHAAGAHEDLAGASDGATSQRNDQGRATEPAASGARIASTDSSDRHPVSAVATEPSRSKAHGSASGKPAAADPAVTTATVPATASRPRRVERPKPAPRVVEVPDGTIRIDSQPAYATIDIDGRRIGVTPIKSWKLSAGRHRVHARCVDGREQDRDVEIRSDEQTNVPLTW
jgi:hypothetical protein